MQNGDNTQTFQLYIFFYNLLSIPEFDIPVLFKIIPKFFRTRRNL